mgnify:CR=1 FL=1|jgi:hypothetical protein
MTFEKWIKQLDRILIKQIGVGAYSLADQPYSLRDRFDAGETPCEVSEEILADPMEWI